MCVYYDLKTLFGPSRRHEQVKFFTYQNGTSLRRERDVDCFSKINVKLNTCWCCECDKLSTDIEALFNGNRCSSKAYLFKKKSRIPSAQSSRVLALSCVVMVKFDTLQHFTRASMGGKCETVLFWNAKGAIDSSKEVTWWIAARMEFRSIHLFSELVLRCLSLLHVYLWRRIQQAANKLHLFYWLVANDIMTSGEAGCVTMAYGSSYQFKIYFFPIFDADVTIYGSHEVYK